jgi:splicing factor 3A subunit 1
LILEAKEREKLLKEKDSKLEEDDEFEIDWDDFMIVQTIEFDEDDDQFIQPDIQQLGIEDVSNKIDKVDQQIRRDLYEMEGVKEASAIEPGMKIVSNYQKRKREDKEATQICPKCGKPIPLSQWTEHMRIELLDPKWREDKIDSLHREKNPMTAQGDEVGRSLKRLVERRPDIAGIDPHSQIESMTQEQTGTGKVIWDGHSNSITRTTANSAMLAQQQRKNMEDAMRNVPNMYGNIPLPPGNFQHPGQMPARPPTQSQLMGYPAPPPEQKPQYGQDRSHKTNPNHQNR